MGEIVRAVEAAQNEIMDADTVSCCMDVRCKGTEKFSEPKDFCLVGNVIEKQITAYDTLGRPYASSTVFNRDTIKGLYGSQFLSMIPNYDAYVCVPSHTEYRRVIGRCFNVYQPLEHSPKPGNHPAWDSLLIRIFGEQIECGWDYLTILYRYPTQVLPVLCLVSAENGTGKSTFGNALSYLFGRNVGFFGQDDLNSSFNSWIKSLIAIFEEISETKRSLNKIKAISTAKSATVNEKFKPQFSFEPFVKIIILSNNEDSFIQANENDIRYWVRKIPPLRPAEFDADFDTKLRDEVPAVLHALSTREIKNQKESRMWFSPAVIATNALSMVVEESRSNCAKDIGIWAEDIGQNFGATETEIFEALGRRYSLNEIRRALKKELKKENNNKRYNDRFGMQKVGRAYLFLNGEDLPL